MKKKDDRVTVVKAPSEIINFQKEEERRKNAYIIFQNSYPPFRRVRRRIYNVTNTKRISRLLVFTRQFSIFGI